MMRLLFWLALAFLVVYAIRKKLRGPAQGQEQGQGPAGASARARTSAREAVAEAMLPCAHCGVHVPASEAVLDEAGRSYCSAEHRRLAGGA